MTDVSTTLMLLLLMVVHHVPSVAIWVLPYFTFSYKKKKKKNEKYFQVNEMDGCGWRDTCKGTVIGQKINRD